MLFSKKRLRSKIRSRAFIYLRCSGKTAAFLFCATFYMVVMKMTIFKSSVNTPLVKDWSALPDNYSMWLFQTLLTKAELETNRDVWSEPDNATLIELDKRSHKVLEVCRMRNLSKQTINRNEFFVDQKHRLVWCNIFKAASSYWLYYFNILGGYEKEFLRKYNETAPLYLARKKFPRPSINELQAALKTPGVLSLLVVREPFVRLLSAYRDKLEIQDKPYYRKLAKTIISKYRQYTMSMLEQRKMFGPTFREFVQYVIDQNKKSGKFNEHWVPYYKYCSPCAVNFSVIAKVETLDKDSMYVIQQLQLGRVLDVKVGERRSKLHYAMNLSRDGKNTTALLRHYFSQLDEYMLNDLLKIYGVDFEMFGYDADVYKRYVRKPQLKV